MRIAYLLFVYRNPLLIGRLIGRLRSENARFFMHVDAKADIAPFETLAATDVTFTQRRVRVQWAEFSGVEAILTLIETALGSGQKFDYLWLLSGSEYPIKSRESIEAFLQKNLGAEFINLIKMPNAEAGKPLSRINTKRISSERPIARLAYKALAKAGFAQRDYRDHLKGLEPYAGNTWWTLSQKACHYVLDYARNNPSVVDFFRETFAPEEMFIHTILGNSPFCSRVRRNLVFEDWTQRAGHPETITAAHLPIFDKERVEVADVFGTGEALMARKFSDASPGLLDELDALGKASTAVLSY